MGENPSKIECGEFLPIVSCKVSDGRIAKRNIRFMIFKSFDVVICEINFINMLLMV